MYIIQAEWLLTSEGLKKNHRMALEGGLIVGLGDANCYPKVDRILQGTLVLPGMVNAHSHAFQRAFRGHVQWKRSSVGTFWTWRDAMYAAVNGLSAEGIEAMSRLVFLEMVESGVTHVGEFHYLRHRPNGDPYPDSMELARRVIRAARSVGLRITLLRSVYASGGIERPLSLAQARFSDHSPSLVLQEIAALRSGTDPLVRVGLAPHSVRAVPRDWLEQFSDFDGPIHAHISEQPTENEACFRAHGCSPLAVFARAGLVGPRFTAVHMTHPMVDDLDMLARSGAGVCVCPSTELDLGDGFLPPQAFALSLCVGSDSHAKVDLCAEARLIELLGRAQLGQRVVLGRAGPGNDLARRLISIASTQGEAALGRSSKGIAVGASADFIVVDLRRPVASGVPPLEAWAFNGSPDWVQETWVAGERLTFDGKHPDRQAIVETALPYFRR